MPYHLGQRFASVPLSRETLLQLFVPLGIFLYNSQLELRARKKVAPLLGNARPDGFALAWSAGGRDTCAYGLVPADEVGAEGDAQAGCADQGADRSGALVRLPHRGGPARDEQEHGAADLPTEGLAGAQALRGASLTLEAVPSVVSALEQALISRYGVLARAPRPVLLRSDNVLVFTTRICTGLVRGYGLKQECITPHCPQHSGMVERLTRSLEERCVHQHYFED